MNTFYEAYFLYVKVLECALYLERTKLTDNIHSKKIMVQISKIIVLYPHGDFSNYYHTAFYEYPSLMRKIIFNHSNSFWDIFVLSNKPKN